MTAAIPTFNSGSLLDRCLDALASAAGVAEVVVLDGGSTDGSVERAEARGDVRVVRLPGTSLIARLNRALDEARGEFVLYLNDDAFVDAHTPRRLAEVMIDRPRVAVSAAALRFGDGRPQRSGSFYRTLGDETFAAVSLTLQRRLRAARGRSARDRGPAEGGGDGVERVTWAPFCAAVVRRSAIRALGGFDDRFSFYYEDQDMCRRVIEAGLEIVVRWDAGAVHLAGGATTAKDPTGYFARYHENRVIYLRKHYPRAWRVYALVWPVRASLHACLWSARALLHRIRREDVDAARARDWARLFWSSTRLSGIRA